MSRPFASALPLLAACLFASPGLAQFGGGGSPRPLQLVISGGATVPTGDFETVHDMGIHADVSLILNLAGFPIRLRPELSFTRFNIKDALTGIGTGTEAGTSDLLGAMGNLELPLGGGLYLLAGVGAFNLSTDAVSGMESVSETKFAVDGGAGLRFRLGGIAGFIEGRVNSVFTEQGTLAFKDVKVIPVTFGLVF